MNLENVESSFDNKNTINNRTYGFALPCGGAEAKAFCDGLAD